MVRPEGLCYTVLLSSCLHTPASAGHPHEDPHLCSLFGPLEGFLWDPWVKGHTSSVARLLCNVAGQCSLPPAVNESFFLSSSSLTFGMVCPSYFFSCPLSKPLFHRNLMQAGVCIPCSPKGVSVSSFLLEWAGIKNLSGPPQGSWHSSQASCSLTH